MASQKVSTATVNAPARLSDTGPKARKANNCHGLQNQ
jgi:hypothetical protein